MWERAEVKSRARVAFKKNYWMCVLITFIMTIVAGGASYVSSISGNINIGGMTNRSHYYGYGNWIGVLLFSLLIIFVVGLLVALFSIFVTAVLEVGSNRFFMENREDMPSVEKLVYVFKSGKYINVVKIMFLKNLFTALWTMLFIVPGIIKHYEYYMIPYILSENPEISYKEAFRISKEMMNGQKMETFILEISFIGWALLGVFTCGILNIFYVNPYIHAAKAELYAVMRAHALYTGALTTKELPGFVER